MSSRLAGSGLLACGVGEAIGPGNGIAFGTGVGFGAELAPPGCGSGGGSSVATTGGVVVIAGAVIVGVTTGEVPMVGVPVPVRGG